MPDVPALAMPDIRRWTGDRAFDLGRRYLRQGALSHLRREDMNIKGWCQGTAPQPYRVQITLDAKGIVSGVCSCPVGSEGRCKHCAALVLAWIDQSEAFVERESLDQLLERLEKAELIALMRQMVKHSPEMEALLDLELPLLLGGKSVAGARQVVDMQSLRRQVVQTLKTTSGSGAYGHDRYYFSQSRHGYYDDDGAWDAPVGDSSALQPLLDMADAYLHGGDLSNAANMYQTIAEGIITYYDSVYEADEEGELYQDFDPLVQHCIENIGACLQASVEPGQREVIVRALAELYRRGQDSEVLTTDDAVQHILLEHARPEERWLAADLIRHSLFERKGDEDEYSLFRRRRIGQTLLRLEHDRLDDETYLRLCRETGMLHEMVERLLALKRIDEAVNEIQQVEKVNQLIPLVDLLRQRGESYIAENLIRRRARTSHDPSLTIWLKERAKEAGDLDEALGLAEQLFWRTPSVALYEEVKDLAQRVGTWDRVSQGVQAHLAKGKQYALLTEVHLLEGEIDSALKTLEQVRPPSSALEWSSTYIVTDSLRIRVAEAAEQSRPNEAIRIYEGEAMRLIEARGRDRYAAAASHLARVRQIYRRLRRESEWEALITRLHTDYKRLPALQDELRQAHL